MVEMVEMVEALLHNTPLFKFEELKAEYPEFSDFFDKNKVEFLYGLDDIKSESELKYLGKKIEMSDLFYSLTYQYSSSSTAAVEDTVIELLDMKRELSKVFNIF